METGAVFFILDNFTEKAFEVFAFGMVDIDRMVKRVGGFLEDPDVALRVRGGAENDLLKKVWRDVRRA